MAAGGENGLGQLNYGVFLTECWEASNDLKDAARHLKMSADQGWISGQVNYAVLRFEGLGVCVDCFGAAECF
jgi:TPR repeat protein